MLVDGCAVSPRGSRSRVRWEQSQSTIFFPKKFQHTFSHMNASSPGVWRSPRLDRFGMWPFGWGAGSPGVHTAQLRPLLLPEMRWGASSREGRKKCICHCHVDNISSNPANQSDGEDNLRQQKHSQLLALGARRAVPQAWYHLEMMHPLPATWSAVNLCQINSVASQLENPKWEEEKHTGYVYDAAFGGRGLWEPSLSLLRGRWQRWQPRGPQRCPGGLSFPPHVQAVVFSPWPCSPRCSQLPAETKKHRSTQAAVSIVPV